MSFRRLLNFLVVKHKLSRLERLTREFLLLSFPREEVVYNLRPDWLKSEVSGKNLELDIFFPRIKVAVEVNGAGHFLDSQRERDRIKRRLCKNLGISLLTINKKLEIFRIPEFIEKRSDLKRERVDKLWKRKIHDYKPDKSAFPALTRAIKYQNTLNFWKKRNKKNREVNFLHLSKKDRTQIASEAQRKERDFLRSKR